MSEPGVRWWRIVEDDGTVVEPFGTRQQAKDEALTRASERGHWLLWVESIGGGTRGIPDDAGPWVRGCRIEPVTRERET